MSSRRAWLLAVCALPVRATEWDQNDFARAYTAWVNQERASTAGSIDAKAMILWQKVKAEWPKLKEHIDAYYNGK